MNYNIMNKRLCRASKGTIPSDMLTDEQAGILIKYLQNVELTAEQQEQLAVKYWEANNEERTEIARAYANLFSKQSFIKVLLDARSRRPGEEGAGPRPSSPVSPTGSSSSRVALSMTSRQLRAAIDDQFTKLSGDGPFRISFGLVKTEKERQEVVDLFASQFSHPEPPELHRLVCLPTTFSTRTRRRTSGTYTWYIRSLESDEVACAVTVIAHREHTRNFVEMPLFATAAGFKRLGLGRLLTSALMAWCAEAKFEFIMISADVQAVPFWERLHFTVMSAKERKSIDFYYQHECYKFKGAEPMIGYCSAEANSKYSVDKAKNDLQKIQSNMTKFVFVGPAGLTE